MAAGPYRMDDNPIYAYTKQATDHRQITLLEAEWNDIKRFSECINIEKQKIDWFSLLIGAASSTLISLAYCIYIYITADNEVKNLSEIVFYSIVTIILLGITLAITFYNKNKTDTFSISIVQHENLCVKIKEIDNRVNFEPLG